MWRVGGTLDVVDDPNNRNSYVASQYGECEFRYRLFSWSSDVTLAHQASFDFLVYMASNTDRVFEAFARFVPWHGFLMPQISERA